MTTQTPVRPLSESKRWWLSVFLWVSCVAWGVGLGAKLFELQVVIGAWAANPPESLALLPYGPKYPSNPGDFFQPLSALLVIGLVGSFVAGWRTSAQVKRWLWLALVALVIIWAATPTLFWPMIRDLYWASTGKQPLTVEATRALVSRWLWLDWSRTALIAVGFVASLQALMNRPQREA